MPIQGRSQRLDRDDNGKKGAIRDEMDQPVLARVNEVDTPITQGRRRALRGVDRRQAEGVKNLAHTSCGVPGASRGAYRQRAVRRRCVQASIEDWAARFLPWGLGHPRCPERWAQVVMTHYSRRILRISLPFASSSISLSK